MTRLDEITKTLKEIKSEYSILRNEIFGIRVSDSSNQQEFGLMENKTLRQIVVETQFQVKQINEKVLDKEVEKEIKFKSEVKLINKKEESDGEFPVVEIQRKTIEEQRNWIKETFNETIKHKPLLELLAGGKSLKGSTVEDISSSVPLPQEYGTSCTIKMTNFLNSTLTDPRYHFWAGSIQSGPSNVEPLRSEVFSFVGKGGYCTFLCSLAVSSMFRLTVRCWSNCNGSITFGIGFTPANVPIDESLFDKLYAMPKVPDIWMIKELAKVPLELFVSHGNLLARGHMSLGPRSVVCVEILGINPDNLSPPYSANENKKNIVDGESIKSSTAFKNLGTVSRLSKYNGRFSCVVEIVNCLSVPLRNRGTCYCKCEKNNFLTPEVLPFRRETFFGADKANVEAMFSYKIDSTNFAIVVALKVGLFLKSFAAAFVQRSVAIGAVEFEALMDPNQWKTHDYRICATASEGVQLIQIGNIRAEIRMTEEEQSLLKIRIFAS